MYKNANHFILASALFIYSFFSQTQTQAQITSDETVSTEVETVDNRNFIITGGTQEGNNLFHSFSEFSVPNEGLASFENYSANIQNIISRVTGGSISNIEGLIKAQGNANLLLINPKGIIFGSNAQLDIGGSFLATTADSIHFADGTQFAATETQTTPLLTVTAPMGLGFGATPGSISSQARRINSNGIEEGLVVKTGKTLALVGADIIIDNGLLRAPGGKIELGSVDNFSFVSLNPFVEGWIFSYETVENFQNIYLSQATLGTNNFPEMKPNGDINLQGKDIAITNKSQIQGLNFGINPGGNLSLRASDVVEVSNSSQLSTTTFSSGTAGEIKVTTGRLLVSNNSSIDTNSSNIFSSEEIGNGGSLKIDASESIEVVGSSSLLATRTSTDGKAGDINLITERLILRDGGQVSSSTFSKGNGGNITVNASEFIEIGGQGNNISNESGSGLFSQTSGQLAIGNGGNVEIATGLLNIRDGGNISVGAVDGSEGKAGSLNISALESVNINGSGSTLLAVSESSKPAGNLTINTNRLTVANGGKVNVSATGTGEAGSLNIDAQDIILEDRGTLTAETSAGDKGNITIDNAETLLLRNNSNITTNAQETATGGDITINSEGIALIDNSNITANAVEGRGGDINITTQRLFQEPDSKITATSEFNLDGTITIESPDVDPTSGLIELPNVPIDAATILAQDLCKFEDDKIAKGSSFIITGRGGLTPTSAEPLENLDSVVRWANRDDIKISKNGLVGVRQRSESQTPEQSYPVIQQSQGWVTTSDGSVWLVANTPETIPQNSRIVHPNCRSLESEATN